MPILADIVQKPQISASKFAFFKLWRALTPLNDLYPCKKAYFPKLIYIKSCKIFWHFIFDMGPQRNLPSLQSWFFWHTTMGIFDHIWPLLHFRYWKWTIPLHMNPSRPIWTIKKVIWSFGKQKMRIMQNSPFWQLWRPLTPKLSYRNTQKHFLRSQKVLDPLHIGLRKGSGGIWALNFFSLYLVTFTAFLVLSHMM